MSATGVEENQAPRTSRIAVLSFLSGAIAFWPGSVYFVDPCPERSGLALTFFYYMGFMMVVVAVVFCSVAVRRIRRSQGTLKGLGLARVGLVLGILMSLGLIGKPNAISTDGPRPRLVMVRLHEAEEKYRVLYPEVGYSPDLKALGPPPAGVPPSAERAGLVSAELVEGRYYKCMPLTFRYEPRVGPDGKIVGYTLWLETEGKYNRIMAMDETGPDKNHSLVHWEFYDADRLQDIKTNLKRFVAEHGDVPESLEEYRRFAEKRYLEKGGPVPSYQSYECSAAQKPFVWKPKGIRTPDGRPVVVMCPLNSHGVSRQFAHGLVQHGKEFCFVTVRENGEVEYSKAGPRCR